MLTEAEIREATEIVRDDLEPVELESLGRDLGHFVGTMTTEYECDFHEGYLLCECGWKSHTMKACWWRERVQEHLESVLDAHEQVGEEND